MKPGYILGTLPSQFVQMRIRPSRWLPALELIWGALVMCMAAAKNVKTIYAIRFLIGLCEASAYPGMMTLLGHWYTPQELGKRSVIFQQSSAVAQMFSGHVFHTYAFVFVFGFWKNRIPKATYTDKDKVFSKQESIME
jgi:ACS family pantothenate transporter-like MFS transporter